MVYIAGYTIMSTTATIRLYDMLKPKLGENGAQALLGFVDTKLSRGSGHTINAKYAVSTLDLYAALKDSLGMNDAKELVLCLDAWLNARIARKLGAPEVSV